MTVTKILTITNQTHLLGTNSERVLTITGEDPRITKILVPVKNSITIDLISVQFDGTFLDALADFSDRNLVLVTLDGVVLTPTTISALKYGGSGGGGVLSDELVKVGVVGVPDYLSTSYFERGIGTHIRPVERIDDTTSAVNKTWSSTKTAYEISIKTDELTKVGAAGSADYLNSTYFERDGVNHIRPAERIDDTSNALNRMWSANKITSELSGKVDSGYLYFTNPRVVFKETFTGTGVATQFTLNGAILNGTFTGGAWAVAHVLNLAASDVTATSNKPVYDSANVFTRNRISVSSISAAGLVTLDHPPRNGEAFYVWYWYELQLNDEVDDYLREDIVASMEETSGGIAAGVPVDTAAFNKYLSAADTNVQLALNTLDDHTHILEDLAITGADGDSVYYSTADGHLVNGVLPLFNVMGEPTGFLSTTTSTITFNNGTRTFSIAPTGASFDYYYKGKKITKTVAQTVQLTTDTQGFWWIYFTDTALVCTNNASAAQFAYLAQCLVSIVYWDAVNQKQIYMSDDRHGTSMDGTTFLYLHEIVGTSYAFGFAPSGVLVDQNGSLNSHYQFGMTTGAFIDEDMINIVGPRFVPIATYPLYYKVGANWTRKEASTTPFLTAGTGRVAYNKTTGVDNFSQEEVSDGQYTLLHVFANNDLGAGKVVCYQGRASYATADDARYGAITELQALIAEAIPMENFLPICVFILQTYSTYTNSIKAAIVSYQGASYQDFRTFRFASTNNTTRHDFLRSLSADDHLQYALLAGRGTGQTLTGGVSGDLTLASNQSNAGKVNFGESGLSFFEEATNDLTIGNLGNTPNAILVPDADGLLIGTDATVDSAGSIDIPSGQHYKINNVNLAAGDVGAEVPLSFSNSVSRSTNDVTLSNDSASPGLNQFYGTTRAGVKGWSTRNIANRVTVGGPGSDCDFTPTVIPGVGNYGAIATAIAYVTAQGYSPSNPWEIKIYPGMYIEPAEMVVNMGLFVISGDARADTVFVIAADPTKDLFILNGGNIHGLHLLGVAVPGKALVKCSTPGTLSVLQGVAINGCYYGIIAEAGAAMVITNLAMLVFAPSMNIGVGVLATGAGTFVALQGCVSTVPSVILQAYASNPIARVVESNYGAEVVVATGTFRNAYIDPLLSDVIFCDNGSKVTLSSVEISDSAVALHIGAGGTGSTISAQSGSFDGNYLNIVCEASTGIIYTTQSVDSTKQYLAPGSKVVGTVQIRDDEQTAFLGTTRYQYLASGRQADLGDFFADFSCTGVCVGGEVTAGTGLHAVVAAGEGWARRGSPYVDTKFCTWIPVPALDLTPSATNWVVYNASSDVIEALVAQPGYGDTILLATIVTDGSGIRFLHKTRNMFTAPAEQLRDYLLSTRKRALASSLTTSIGSSARKFSISSGSYYIAMDLMPYVGATDAGFSAFYGTNGATEVSGQTQLNITQFDSAGTLTTMTPDWYRSDTLILTSDGRLSVIFGTVENADPVLVRLYPARNTPTFMEPTSFPLAKLIVKQGVGIETSVTDIIDIREQPSSGGSGGGSGGVSSHSALSDLDKPADHTWAMLVDGTRAMSGNLSMGAHNITFTALSNATVDGVVVSAHAARHLPGGLDALTIAAPSSVGTANAQGSAASFSASDHIHDHGSQSTGTHHAVANGTTPGFMSAAHYTKVNNSSATPTASIIPIADSSGKLDGWVTGNTVGAASSTDKAIVRFSGTLGKTIQDSLVTIDDSGSVNIPTGQHYKINSVNLAATDVGAEPTLTKGALTETTSSVLTINNGSTAVIGSGTTIAVTKADATHAGYVSSTDYNLFYNNLTKRTYLSAGLAVEPTFADNHDGSANIGAGTVRLYSDAAASTPLEEYTLAPIIASFADNTQSYVVASYSTGAAALSVITNVLLINESTVVPVYTVYRSGNTLHVLSWDNMAYNLANKIHYRLVKTERFSRQSGLDLTESSGRIVNVSEGVIFYGADSVTLSTFISSSDELTLWYHTGSAWTSSTVTQYNNSQYDPGTNLTSLGAGRYAVNWVYRGVETDKHCSIVLGSGDYKLNEATASQPPASLPSLITAHKVLVGRIIVKNGDPTATEIDSAWSVNFTPAQVRNHNDLALMDGGTPGQYYHMTAAEHTVATQAATGSLNGYLTSGNFTTFAGKVDGPASAVDSNFASFNTTTGKLIKDSGVSASTFVPYTGAASDVDLGTHKLSFERAQLSLTPTVGTHSTGKMYWDATWKTLAVELEDTVVLQVGQETLAYVYNGTGTPILNGSAVYISGVQSGVPSVSLALANADATSFVLGVITTSPSIASGAYGYATIRGHVNDINTSAWNIGDSLYLSPTIAGALTNIQPSGGQYDVRVGRVMLKDVATGRVYVNIRPQAKLTDLSDVTITTPTVDEVLRYNGIEWVNGASATSSASAGIEFFPDTTDIIASTNQNSFTLETLSKTPVTTAESVEAINCTNNTVIGSGYLYNTALGRTSIDAGNWAFDFYLSVSRSDGGRVSSCTINMFKVSPYTSPTITTSSSGTTRTCIASSGTPFATANIDASATNTVASFVQTPKGVYQILSRVSDTEVTIAVPTTYTNESTVAFSVWKKLFGATSPTITNLTTNYGLYTTNTSQSAFTTLATDKLGMVVFGTSNNTTTVNYVYNGQARYSHLSTPLITLHNNLAGLYGGAANDYYHLTSAQTTLATQYANGSQGGLLSSSDFNTFSGKESVLTFQYSVVRNTNTVNLVGDSASPGNSQYYGTNGSGTKGFYSFAVPTTVTVANEATDTTCFPLFATAATGDLGPKTVASLTLNSNTGLLTATSMTSDTFTANTGVVPDANDGAYLGTTSLSWSDLFLASGAVINFANSNVTLTHATGSLTLAATTLALGATNLTMTGSIADTTNRVFKGWFTDLQCTNAIAGSVTGNAGTVTVANEATDTTCFPLFAISATGSLEPKTVSSLTFNSNTGLLTSTSLTGDTLTANTGVVPDANDGAYLGTTALGFSDLFLASGGVINWANGNTTITHATGSLTVAATTFALGSTNLTMTGSIADTTNRVFKGWFTDLQCTNAIAGSITGNAATFTVADESTDTTCFPVFVTTATGSMGGKTVASFTFNSNTGLLTTTSHTADTFTANTGVVPDANDGAYLGTTALGWSDLFLASGAVINFANSNVTLTHATGSLTVAATTLALGSTNLTMTGSIADTTNRVFKGWFTDLQCTNAIAGSVTGNAGTVTVANEATDTTCFPLFAVSATGSLEPKTVSSLTFNSNTGLLTSTSMTANTFTANTGVVPDADDGAYLGTTALGFSDLFLASGGVINWANGNATITHATGSLTVAATTLALGSTNLTMTGAIASTGARVSKGWFADLESSAGIVLGVDAATNTAGFIKMYSAGANNFFTSFTAGTQSADAAYTLPTALPASDMVLQSSNAGVLSWVGAPAASTISVADSTSATCWVGLFEAASGTLAPKTDEVLLYNASTGSLSTNTLVANTGVVPDANDGAYLGTTALGWSDLFLASTGVINWANGNATITHATGSLTVATTTLALGATNLTMTGSIADTTNRVFKGWFTDLQCTNAMAGSITGNAATVTVANEATDTTCFPLFVTTATGSMEPKTVSSLTFNSNTGLLTSTSMTANTLTANTGVVPDADDGAYLGTTALGFSDLFLASGAVINFANSNVTLTHATGSLTVAATTFALGATNITMSGSIGITGTRVFKGWFTDLECTNAIAGSITGNAATHTVTNEATDTTCFPLFATTATGSLGACSNANLTYNSNTGQLNSTIMTTTGNASGTTIYVANCLYGTGAAPSTAGLPYGTIYFQYTA